ncbi:Ion channel [Carpediemonas membranifera]|uniref:Ion channel n=1 Tax=Carpediemonas membranifera TaxID=201153 RepID=A0A8J6C123_9EUKA|nr:Ion channel [Carpediemonas membranifera]|eukprot:KAG9397146.1 Ion channel [Carpediemonas membranifera]
MADIDELDPEKDHGEQHLSFAEFLSFIWHRKVLLELMQTYPWVPALYALTSIALTATFIVLFATDTMAIQGPDSRDVPELIASKYPKVLDVFPSLAEKTLTMAHIHRFITWASAAVAAVCLVDNVLAMTISPSIIRYLLHPLTILTIIPLLLAFLRAYNDSIPSFAFLRVFQLLAILSHLLPKSNILAVLLIRLLTVMLVATVTCAGLLYFVEVELLAVQDEYAFSYPAAVYFVASSVTLVGYGDVQVNSTVGRTIIMGMVLLTVLYIPVQTNRIYHATTTTSEHGVFTKKTTEKHVIVAGTVTAHTLTTFLATFFSQRTNRRRRVVVIVPTRWPATVEASIAAMLPETATLVFIQGSPCDSGALTRADVRRCSELFILNNCGADYETDTDTVSCLLSAAKAETRARFFALVPSEEECQVVSRQLRAIDPGAFETTVATAQVLPSPRQARRRNRFAQRRKVTLIPFHDLSNSILATASAVPGLINLLHPLHTPAAEHETEPLTHQQKLAISKLNADRQNATQTNVSDHLKHAGLLVDIKVGDQGQLVLDELAAPEWLQHYADGQALSLFRTKLPHGIGDVYFSVLATELFLALGVVVIGVDVLSGLAPSSQPTFDTFLNPPPRSVVSPGEIIIVLARDASDVRAIHDLADSESEPASDRSRSSSFISAGSFSFNLGSHGSNSKEVDPAVMSRELALPVSEEEEEEEEPIAVDPILPDIIAIEEGSLEVETHRTTDKREDVPPAIAALLDTHDISLQIPSSRLSKRGSGLIIPPSQHRHGQAYPEMSDPSDATEPPTSAKPAGPVIDVYESHLMDSDITLLPKNYQLSRHDPVESKFDEFKGCRITGRVPETVSGHTVLYGRIARFVSFIEYAPPALHPLIVFMTPERVDHDFQLQYSDRPVLIVPCSPQPRLVDFERCRYLEAQAIVCTQMSVSASSPDSILVGLMVARGIKEHCLIAQPHLTVESNDTQVAMLTASEIETRYFFSGFFMRSSFFATEWPIAALAASKASYAPISLLTRLFLTKDNKDTQEAAHRFRTVTLPPSLAGLTFGDVFKEFSVIGLTALGVYRRLPASKTTPYQPYVTLVMPSVDMPVYNDDRVLILR